MEFTSPRFIGNPLLEEILNDPDTGNKKLGPGSPADAVRPVQRALLDLEWVSSYFVTPSGAVLVPAQFCDGAYGGWTSQTVLGYKRHYDIHFPPSAPTGTFDGFVGPATLKWLDGHCALLDEADAAITARVDELAADGRFFVLELAPPDGVGRTTRPVRHSAGATRAATIDGAVGALIYKRGIGTFALHGPLFVDWVVQELAEGSGDATDTVGFPTSDEFETESGSGVLVERGQLSHDAEADVALVELDPELSVLHFDHEF